MMFFIFTVDMTILALDIASVTGWAISPQLYGTWNCKTLKDESVGMKLLRFKAKLREVVELEKPELIVYERPAGAHGNSLIHEAKMIGIVEAYCEEKGIEYKAYSAKEIKKFGTGSGSASKNLMVEKAKDRYGYMGFDDNEADALHLLHLAKYNLGIN